MRFESVNYRATVFLNGVQIAQHEAASIPFEGRVNWTEGGVETIAQHTERWRASGATHLAINTMHAGFATADAHIDALAAAAEAMGVKPS